MKSGLLLLGVALLLGGLVGTLMVRDPGYVLISYADTAVETSLWFAVFVLLAGYCLIRLINFLFVKVTGSGGRVGNWLRGRKDRSARQQTARGLLAMAQGEWAQAQKLLTNSAAQADTPLVNYLNAARAAARLGDIAGRDRLLREAGASASDSKMAVGLTQAELQQSAGQWEACLATLLRLRETSPRNPLVLQMLLDSYRELGDWQAVIELLPDLRKQKFCSAEKNHELQCAAWAHRFDNATLAPDQIWTDVPKELKSEIAVVRAYCAAEMDRGDSARAADAVRHALERSWSSELVQLYGRLQGEPAKEQLIVAERWLKDRPGDAELLLALGRIAMRAEEFPKAREYLETSLRLDRNAEVYAELGRLCSAMGDLDRGNEYLVQALPSLPDLPLPQRG